MIKKHIELIEKNGFSINIDKKRGVYVIKDKNGKIVYSKQDRVKYKNDGEEINCIKKYNYWLTLQDFINKNKI